MIAPNISWVKAMSHSQWLHIPAIFSQTRMANLKKSKYFLRHSLALAIVGSLSDGIASVQRVVLCNCIHCGNWQFEFWVLIFSSPRFWKPRRFWKPMFNQLYRVAGVCHLQRQDERKQLTVSFPKSSIGRHRDRIRRAVEPLRDREYSPIQFQSMMGYHHVNRSSRTHILGNVNVFLHSF